MSKRIAIILAAGQSTRMKTEKVKVLHEVCGRPMLDYVLDACRHVNVEKIFVVVGYGKEQIIDRYKGCDDMVFVEQAERKGTGHAVMMCKDAIGDFDGQCLVLCGDTPLIRKQTTQTLFETHESQNAKVTLATTLLDDPFGYGRIVRDASGNIQGIVEQNDCTEEQKQIKEINPAYYCFDWKLLDGALDKITPNNAKNEYYLTDALHILISEGHRVAGVTAVEPEESMGVNNRKQLAEASRVMQDKIHAELMDAGVTIVDPVNTWVDIRAEISQDTILEPFTYIYGNVKIGSACRVGPFAYLHDGTVMSDGTITGPFAQIQGAK